jgi:signal transduction histidine kinase
MGARVRGRWTPEEGLALYLEEDAPDRPNPLDLLLDAGQTVAIADATQDERAPAGWDQIRTQAGRSALALIPLIAGGQRIGLVLLSHPAPHQWPEADLQPYQATAAQLATAIDHRQQYHLLYERGRQIAVLQERQRLARDLHDSVTQLIFSVTLIAQSLAPAWRRDPAEGERRVGRLLELSQAALAEMRALLAELRPPEPAPPVRREEREAVSVETPVPGIVRVHQAGLVPALHQHIAGVARDGLQIGFDSTGYISQAPAQEEALYRITQEALNNVIKHAQARRVEVTLCTGAESTCLVVADDGVGLPADPLVASRRGQAGGGLGVQGMQERAAALGGALLLEAAAGGGTAVAATIPRKDRAA